MEKKIFTISREYGAGGLPVGRLIAEKLGIPFYDKKLVEHVADQAYICFFAFVVCIAYDFGRAVADFISRVD